MRNDREGGLEGSLQTLVGALLGRHVGLQEGGVGVLLHLQQIGDRQHVLARAETLSDALAFGV